MRHINWNDLKVFVTVAHEGSLTAAATAIGVSVATLGRRIDALESGLGINVIRRSPQGITVTSAGQSVLELIEPGAERFAQLDRLVRAIVASEARPPIRVSTTEPMVTDVLAPQIPRLLSDNPDIRLELESSLERSNLNRGDADLAIRMVRPDEDSLVTRRLPAIKMGLFASPAYVDNRGPNLDAEVSHLLWYDRAYGDIAENVWLKSQSLQDRVIFRTGSVRALLEAAKVNVGIAPLPAFLAIRHGLVPITSHALPDRTPWLVFHRDSRNDKTLKTVRAWVNEACRTAFGWSVSAKES